MDNQNNTYKEIWDTMMGADNIVLAAHVRPDLDSISSCLALEYVLNRNGKSVTVLSTDRLGYIQEILDTSKIILQDPDEFDFSNTDLYIGPDIAEEFRISHNRNFKAPVTSIKIDHHPNSSYWGNMNYVDTESASTTVIIYNMLQNIGEPIDEKLATILLSGLLGDTGFFQYDNVRPQDLKMATDLMEKGANLFQLQWDMKFHDDFKLFKLKEMVYKNLKMDWGKKYAYSHITLAEKATIDIDPHYRHMTLADLIKTLDGVHFVWTVIELHNGKFKVSFRAHTPGFDTTIFSRDLGGGGHFAASAAELDAKTIGEAIEIIKNTISSVPYQI